MTTEQAIAFGTVAATLVMLAWGKWRYDVVAVLAMLVGRCRWNRACGRGLRGLRAPCGHNGCGRAYHQQGTAERRAGRPRGQAINPLRERPNLQITAQCLVIAVLSSFMNNVGALALMLPVALRNAYRNRYPPAMSLMPLAFASLLGGLTTLIGTPPNIIIAGIRANVAGQPFGMFDFVPVGLTVAAAGLAFLAVAGRYLLPKATGSRRPRTPSRSRTTSPRRALSKAEVIGKSIVEFEKLADGDVTVTALIRRTTGG